jgi:hypothetical protein
MIWASVRGAQASPLSSSSSLRERTDGAVALDHCTVFVTIERKQVWCNPAHCFRGPRQVVLWHGCRWIVGHGSARSEALLPFHLAQHIVDPLNLGER